MNDSNIEKMLNELVEKPLFVTRFPGSTDARTVELLREDAIALLRELAAAREAMRWRRLGDEKPQTSFPNGTQVLVVQYESDGKPFVDSLVYDRPYRWWNGTVGWEAKTNDLWRPLPAPPPAATEGRR